MVEVGLVVAPEFRQHDTGNHPESARRLEAIEAHLKKTGLWERTTRLTPKPALREDILLAHSPDVFERVEQLIQSGGGYLDADTIVSSRSAEAAALAAGGVMGAVSEIQSGALERALALVRPPGHHAIHERSMGFCLYNNVAIGIRFLFKHYEVERVAVVDFDVHHGNGTQDIFYEDPEVFVFSIHQYPLFPMSGLARERGRGKGEGTTLNVPLPPGTSREDYRNAYEKGLDAVFRFQPQFLFISAGFDAHRKDPLSDMRLESEDFGQMTRSLVERAKAMQVQGIVSCLEGGYHLQALSESVAAHLEALL